MVCAFVSKGKRSRKRMPKTQKQKYAYIRPVTDEYGDVSSFEVMGCAKRGGLIRVSENYGLALLRHTTKVGRLTRGWGSSVCR